MSQIYTIKLFLIVWRGLPPLSDTSCANHHSDRVKEPQQNHLNTVRTHSNTDDLAADQQQQPDELIVFMIFGPYPVDGKRVPHILVIPSCRIQCLFLIGFAFVCSVTVGYWFASTSVISHLPLELLGNTGKPLHTVSPILQLAFRPHVSATLSIPMHPANRKNSHEASMYHGVASWENICSSGVVTRHVKFQTRPDLRYRI